MPMLKVIAAFIVGAIAGGIVNMTLVTVGPAVIPPPEGVDVTDMESLKTSMHLLSARHFVFPFLAHALGTLVGALVGYLLAPKYKIRVAWLIGVFTLLGGIAASSMIPAPKVFIAVDLIFAYLPMAWLAIKLGAAIQGSAAPGPAA